MAAKTKSTKKDEKPLPRRYRVENFVIPTAGPHKGHRHKVIHVHPDGSVNIQPWDLDPARVKYKMGVAYARLDQLEPAWLKEDTDEDDELTNQITEQVAEKAPADERENVIMQLRKAVSMGGTKTVKFADGSSHEVLPAHAAKVLDHHASFAKPAEKAEFQSHIDKSHTNFHEVATKGRLRVVQEAVERVKYREIPSDPIFGLHEGYAAVRTVKKSAAARRILDMGRGY